LGYVVAYVTTASHREAKSLVPLHHTQRPGARNVVGQAVQQQGVELTFSRALARTMFTRSIRRHSALQFNSFFVVTNAR